MKRLREIMVRTSTGQRRFTVHFCLCSHALTCSAEQPIRRISPIVVSQPLVLVRTGTSGALQPLEMSITPNIDKTDPEKLKKKKNPGLVRHRAHEGKHLCTLTSTSTDDSE